MTCDNGSDPKGGDAKQAPCASIAEWPEGHRPNQIGIPMTNTPNKTGICISSGETL